MSDPDHFGGVSGFAADRDGLLALCTQRDSGNVDPVARATRLSTAGGQQAVLPDGRLGVVLFGEIYDTPGMRKRLGIPETLPLPEVVLAAWQRWVTDLPEHTNGVFALALQQGDDLFLYRDPSGLVGLFFTGGRSNRLAFASDLDALLALRGKETRLARHAIHEYLRFGDIAAPNTCYEQLQAVEPGQLLRWAAGTAVAHVAAPTVTDPEGPKDFADAVETLDALMQHGVDMHASDAQRPAAFLSGGVDSALICAFASRFRTDLTAVTVGFEGDEFDETPVAARIAEHLGVRHEVLRFGHEDYRAAFVRLTRHLEQPMADPATLATVLALEHCRDRHDVVLDGTGADEAVGAMPPRHVRLAVAYGSLMPTRLRRRLAQIMRRVPLVAGYAPILDFEHPAETMIRWHGFSRTEVEALCGEPVSFEHTTFYRTFAHFPRHAHFERYTALLNAMPCERLTQASRVTGVHMRYPFCDRDTNRFLRQLPGDFRYLPGEPKRILRALLARHVPREIWDAPKHGFNFPLGEFLTARNHELVRRHLLDSDVWRHTKLLSAEGVQRYGRGFIAGDRRLTFRVWALVVLGAWLEHHPGVQA